MKGAILDLGENAYHPETVLNVIESAPNGLVNQHDSQVPSDIR
jgi:hypothetical protein